MLDLSFFKWFLPDKLVKDPQHAQLFCEKKASLNDGQEEGVLR